LSVGEAGARAEEREVLRFAQDDKSSHSLRSEEQFQVTELLGFERDN
jgi:hypothetical protein